MNSSSYDLNLTQTHKDYREDLLRQETADAAFKRICNVFETFGFNEAYYSYGAVQNAPGKLNNLRLEKIVILQSTMSSARTQYFQDEYNPSRKFDKDPTLIPFHHGNMKPFISGMEYVHQRVLNPDQRYLLAMQQNSDIMGAGSVIFPVMTPQTNRIPSGSLTAISDLKGRELKEATAEMMRHIHGLIDVFVEKTAPLTINHICTDIGLSKREKECLQYIADGFRTIDIADNLNRSKSMIDRHVASARRKLKARTLPEAVARALTYKIIQQ